MDTATNKRLFTRGGYLSSLQPRPLPRVRIQNLFFCLCLGFRFFSSSPSAYGQQSITVEERFQDVFLTAGYCTAFGAAFGTALLAWTTDPSENLKYVAIGASLGFIGGSVLGTYVVLQPMAEAPEKDPIFNDKIGDDKRYFSMTDPDKADFPRDTGAGSQPWAKKPKLVLAPVFNLEKTPQVVGLRANVTVAQF